MAPRRRGANRTQRGEHPFAALGCGRFGCGLWEWDPGTGLLTIDQAARVLLGLPASRATAPLESWRAQVHPDDFEAVLEEHSRYVRDETRFFQSTLRLRHVDGQWVPVFARGSIIGTGAHGSRLPHGDSHGTPDEALEPDDAPGRERARAASAPDRFVGLLIDISFLKAIDTRAADTRIDEERRRHVDEVFTLVADLVHQLANPLTIVMGRLDELRSDVRGRAELEVRVASALDAALRMATTIDVLRKGIPSRKT